jgi:adenylate cyclase
LGAIDERTENVILPKSDFAKALQYVRNHLVELKRYLDDPKLPMDNNDAEQLMKQVALGRKNWLFAGSVAGGERNAGFLTLVSSAHRNDLDVWVYVKDVLDQLLAGSTDYESLLPWNWAAEHPEAIRQYRVEERRDRATRKQFRRALRRQLGLT